MERWREQDGVKRSQVKRFREISEFPFSPYEFEQKKASPRMNDTDCFPLLQTQTTITYLISTEYRPRYLGDVTPERGTKAEDDAIRRTRTGRIQHGRDRTLVRALRCSLFLLRHMSGGRTSRIYKRKTLSYTVQLQRVAEGCNEYGGGSPALPPARNRTEQLVHLISCSFISAGVDRTGSRRCGSSCPHSRHLRTARLRFLIF
ncbi:hypothetical protein J6590_030740 [Homalodisca vitripennis]|nr:hypothetical protein J6590_030740 [Homalodisca vitripennis]